MSTPFVVGRVCQVLRALPPQPDNAHCVHAAAIEALAAAGFYVYPEFSIVYGDGEHERGRIDIAVLMHGQTVAIEIDARKPRVRSLKKLRAFDGGRVLALRGVAGGVRIHGIDAVVPIRVRLETTAEATDKRTVGRAVRKIRGQA